MANIDTTNNGNNYKIYSLIPCTYNILYTQYMHVTGNIVKINIRGNILSYKNNREWIIQIKNKEHSSTNQLLNFLKDTVNIINTNPKYKKSDVKTHVVTSDDSKKWKDSIFYCKKEDNNYFYNRKHLYLNINSSEISNNDLIKYENSGLEYIVTLNINIKNTCINHMSFDNKSRTIGIFYRLVKIDDILEDDDNFIEDQDDDYPFI